MSILKVNILCLLITTSSLSFSANTFEETNIALGKNVSISGGTGASNVVDGNMTTKWVSAAKAYQSVTIDLGANYDVSKIVIDWADNTGSGTYDLQFGTESDIWDTSITISGATEVVQSTHASLYRVAKTILIN